MVADHGSQHTSVLPVSWGRMVSLTLVVLASVVLGYLVFERYLRVAATILVLAGMLTYLLKPTVDWLTRLRHLCHLPHARTGAVLLIYLVLASGLYFLGSGVAQTLFTDVRALTQTWASAREQAPPQIAAMRLWYEHNIPTGTRARLDTAIEREIARIPDKYVPLLFERLTGIASVLGSWIGVVVELIFVPLVAFYFLTDAARVREQLLYFVTRRHRERVLEYAGGMNRIMRQYVRGQFILCAVAWAVVTLGLLLLDIPGALLLGVIAGVARAIPVLGPVVGGIPVLGAVLLHAHGEHTFWWALLGFTSLHLFESKYLMPRILGNYLNVHPVLIILSLLVGYELLGLLGMFIAPPAVAVIRFVLAVRRGEGPGASRAQLRLPGLAPADAEEVAA